MDKSLLIKELAKMIGVADDTVISWEKREIKPTGRSLEKLKDVLRWT